MPRLKALAWLHESGARSSQAPPALPVVLQPEEPLLPDLLMQVEDQDIHALGERLPLE